MDMDTLVFDTLNIIYDDCVVVVVEQFLLIQRSHQNLVILPTKSFQNYCLDDDLLGTWMVVLLLMILMMMMMMMMSVMNHERMIYGDCVENEKTLRLVMTRLEHKRVFSSPS